MTLRLPLSGKRHATIVSAYAPTMTNLDEVKVKFYDDLDSVICATPRTDKLILLGDFNARVGTDHQNRREGNDQESIQLSHTSHQRHQRERNTNTKQLKETSLAESQTDSYFPTKWSNGYPKQKDVSDTHIQRQTITKINHDRRTALERLVKKYFIVCVCVGGGGGGGGGA